MPVNPYFNNFPSEERITGESLLMESIIAESIQMMGHNVYYIPRESLDTMDYIFGESTKVKFKHAYQIEAYIANVEGFEGDNDFFSKFGLEVRETSNFVLSRRSFRRIIPSTLRARPQEGDLVYIPLMHRMFEIKFIEEELMFFSLGKRNPYIYEMRCELFRYSEEEIDTGVEDIDDVAEENAYTIRLQLDKTTGSGKYIDNQTVFQSPDGTWANNTAHATVKEWYASNGSLFVYNVAGQFRGNANLYSNTSTTIYKIQTMDERTDFNQYDMQDNEYFDNDTTLILDLSELNPFGTP